MSGERRKDYMVSKRVHVLYMLTWITSLALVGSLVMMAYTLKGARNALPEAGQASFIAVGALAFVIVCSALLLAVYTIVHTHRLMGSAYRIGVCLREINSGQPTRIHLRDGDFFLEIADEVNLLADKAAGKVESTDDAEKDQDSKKEGDEASNSEQPA
jgi:hypothetical protein